MRFALVRQCIYQTWGQIQSICILLYLNTLFEVFVFVFVFKDSKSHVFVFVFEIHLGIMYFRGSQILKYMKGKVAVHHTNSIGFIVKNTCRKILFM